mgnify:CR=1 FL=1
MTKMCASIVMGAALILGAGAAGAADLNGGKGGLKDYGYAAPMPVDSPARWYVRIDGGYMTAPAGGSRFLVAKPPFAAHLPQQDQRGPADAARLRFFMTSLHTDEQLVYTADAIKRTLDQIRAEAPKKK